ncbi:hypothetical protein C8R46DRAFT_881509 [Mycena filopes]|nr:hypothetical protein C8R46DRAFT_881509 [Mycena filopes]
MEFGIQEMQSILAQPGFISNQNGGAKLRQLHKSAIAALIPDYISLFGRAVYLGDRALVQEMWEQSRTFNLLHRTETPLKLGYTVLLILGSYNAQGHTGRHLETLSYLFSKGLPVDIQDIVGLTALHHATYAYTTDVNLTRCLLENGANVNHQSRYGEVAMFMPMQLNSLPTINILMEFGLDVDLAEAAGITVRSHLAYCGPEVTATINHWLRKRSGEQLPHAENCCDKCGVVGPLKNCGKCKVARYCSVDCQGEAWPEHKKTCQSFGPENSVELIPHYDPGLTLPVAEATRLALGYPVSQVVTLKQLCVGHVPRHIKPKGKTLVVKVQVPRIVTNHLMIYTKTRNFACLAYRTDNPTAYDRISAVVGEGSKAYFVAELVDKDRLIIKISQKLADQPW